MTENRSPIIIHYMDTYENIIDYVNEKITKERRTVYVVDETKKYLGCIGRTELEKSLREERICINNNSIKVVHCKEEKDIVKNIWRNNRKIANVPIIDTNEYLLYELQIDASDINEYEISILRSRGVLIGEDVSIINSSIDYTWGFLISIGNNVTITNATIYAHDASMKRFTGKTKLGKVIIGNDVFIGYGSIILPDVSVGNKVIIGAGTVVDKDVPDNSVVVGNPMRIVKSFDEFMDKYKKQLEEHPIYDVNPNDLTWEEKVQMRQKMKEAVYIN